MDGQGELSRPASAYGSGEGDVKGQGLDVTGLIVDQLGTIPSPSSTRGRKSQRPSRHVENAIMDVDLPDDSPFSAATSSSISSSSRSSLRMSRPTVRDRAGSLTFSNPRLAEPKLDKSTALGAGAAWPAQEGQDEAEKHGRDHHGAHRLRHLVGGIFRRRSHSDRQPHHPSEERVESHADIDMRPQSLAFHRSGEVGLPVVEHAVPPPGSAQPPDSSTSLQSPSLAHQKGSGTGRTLTPRVRTRAERSVDSFRADRAGLGAAAGAIEIGMVGGDREERRARFE